MTPNVYFKALICAVLLGLSFVGGYYVEHLRFVAYQEKVAADGKVQEEHNKDLIKQQQLTTQKVENDYQNKLDRIKSYYSGLHVTSSSKLSIASPTQPFVDGTATDPQFAEKCTITTQQLESLQDFVREQLQIK